MASQEPGEDVDAAGAAARARADEPSGGSVGEASGGSVGESSGESIDPGLDAIDRRFMGEALALAREAAARGDVPVGALVVMDGRIVGTGFNTREHAGDPSGHAEIVALREACRATRRWRVDGATLYVTLEPCPMCAGALVNARVARLVYGADDPKAGAVRTLYRICDDPRLNHRLRIRAGVLADACGAALQSFFRAIRARGRVRQGEGAR